MFAERMRYVIHDQPTTNTFKLLNAPQLTIADDKAALEHCHFF